MIPIDIKVNADEALRLYTNLINKLSDISQELFLCRQMLLDEFQKNLDNQLNPDGSKYKKLSERYKKSKAYKRRERLSPKEPGTPLDTDKYRKSFQAYNESRKLVIKQNHVSQLIHESGGIIANGFGKGIRIVIPKRSMIWISNKKLAEFAMSVAREIIKSAKRS